MRSMRILLILAAGVLPYRADRTRPVRRCLGTPAIPDRSPTSCCVTTRTGPSCATGLSGRTSGIRSSTSLCRNNAEDWYLTIGGEARDVWEQIGNDNWGQQPYMNGYLNQRYMLSFDAHYGKHVRSFIELKSGLNSYRIGGPRPIDEKKLDFQAGFLELDTSKGANSVALRVGRQELEYGSGRFD